MEPTPHPRQTTYGAGHDHPSVLLGSGGSISQSSDEDGDRQQHVRMIPIQQRDHNTSSDESLNFLQRPPIAAPRSPPQISPTNEQGYDSGGGRTIAGMVGATDSRPDSGIPASPILPPQRDDLPSPRPQQLFTSSLMDRFLPKNGRDGQKNNKKQKPNLGKIFSSPQSSPEGQGLDLDDLEEGPPRVRRPSGRYQHRPNSRDEMEIQQGPPPPATPLSISINPSSRPPPPLPSVPPPKLSANSPTHEPLLQIQSLPSAKKSKGKPTSLTIGTAEIPPPPPLDSDDDNNNTATLPIHKSQIHYQPRSRTPLSPVRLPDVAFSQPQQQQTPLSPSRRSPFAGREPGITSYQDHFLYSSHSQTTTQSHPPPPPPPLRQRHRDDDDYGLPSPEEYFSPSTRTSPSQPPPPTPATASTSPRRRGEGSSPRPAAATPQQRSAAEAVADLLTSRQPLSLRIHIQKHKTETSYKKSQTFGSNPKSNEGKNGGEFSESSI